MADEDTDRQVMHGAYVALLLSGARSRHLEVGDVLARSGIPHEVLDDPARRVTPRQFGRLITVLTRTTGDELWGLGTTPVRPGTFATLCRIVALCPTLGEAIRLGIRFYRSVTDDVAFTLRCTDGEARLSVRTRAGTDDRAFMLHSAAMFFAYGLACWLVGRRIPLRSLDTALEERTGTAYASRIFRAPTVRFRSGRTVLAFDTAWLDRPVLADPNRLSEFLRTLPGSLLLGYRDHTAFGERLRALLRRHVADPPAMAEAAGVLGVSTQTLRRNLTRELLTYQELKDEVRFEVASDLLTGTAMTVEKVAHTVGFAELSSFHRAFRRWTGAAPSQYRVRHRGEVGHVVDARTR